MINQYETVFIVTPIVTEDQLEETIRKYMGLLKELKADIVAETNWGLRKTAYPIQKKNNGYYYIVEYKAEGEIIQKLETQLDRDENILRFLTMKLDKYAVKYFVKVRKEREADKNKTKEEVIIADASANEDSSAKENSSAKADVSAKEK